MSDVNYPTDRKYSQEHEWVTVDGDIATVGITHHAQAALGDIVFIDMPEVGADIEAHTSVAEIESVKAVSDVYTPVSGNVTEVNEALDGEEETVNSDPHGAGWLFKVKLSDPAEIDTLMDAAGYAAFLADQD
ncbi:MAG: glycine cleavage system protein GcvH [Myxococcota bacterium]|nr:glycine cleavage system protein GcvH [Myxococcota bacterium]